LPTESLEEVYRRYFPVIRERCRRVLASPQEADDVAQETFIRFWQSAKSSQPPRDAAAWIHRTAVHLSIDRMRRSSVRPELANDTLEPQAAFIDPAEALQNRTLLAQLARRVPTDALEAGVLHRVDGLTQPEAAALMGCSERTFRRLLVTLDERLARFRSEVLT
jgi:RNA polymerase sigma-70 factor (ECF subfamily)